MPNGKFVVGAERYQTVYSRDVLRRLEDAVRRAKDLMRQTRREQRFTIRGKLGAKQRAQVWEERDVVALLNDLIFGFRDLMYILYAQMREEQIAGRSRVYANFKRTIERQLNILISELQRLRAEEGRL